MRILMVVTLVTPDGAYGGPVRVALNQAAALIERGHTVVVAGGCDGFDAVPTESDGVPLKLFPVRRVIPRTGFAGLSSPGLQSWLHDELRGFDVVHVHAARDFVTLPAARLARRWQMPYFLQTHGMIVPSRHPLSTPLDIGWTRATLRSARRVFYLTPTERRDLETVGGDSLPLTELRNGVPGYAIHAEPDPPEVLYLARLQGRKRPTFFVRMATVLAASHPDVRFTLVGPDEGEATDVKQLIDESGHADRITWEGPIPPEAAPARIGRASIYVLPSINEPYPMSVLEAMSSGVPVVITDSCGLAPVVGSSKSGLVADETLESLVAAVGTLLDDPAEAREMGLRAAALTHAEFSMDAVAQQLEAAYTS